MFKRSGKSKTNEKFLKAQNFTELALLIGIVGLVFMAMQVYIKRGLSGKVKDLTDYLISPEQETYSVDTSGLEKQTSESVSTLNSKVTENKLAGGVILRNSTETSTVKSSSESLERHLRINDAVQ